MSGVANVGCAHGQICGFQQGPRDAVDLAKQTQQSGASGLGRTADVQERRLAKGLEAAGYDQATIDEVLAEVEAAIQAATEQPANSDEATTPRQRIRDAIRATLQEHGIDAEKIREAFRTLRENGSQPTREIRAFGGDHSFPPAGNGSNGATDFSVPSIELVTDTIVGLDENA